MAHTAIMNHTRPLREFIPFAVRAACVHGRSGLRWLRNHVPGACPLCHERSSGARLCPICHGFVMASMNNERARCPCCCLAGYSHACPDCARQPFAFERAIAVFDYAHPGDLLIRQFKMQLRFGMAPMLAAMLAQAYAQATPALPAPDLVVPVPGHPQALRARGFSPARELAAQLCSLQGWRADYRLLSHRAVAGVSQKRLGRRRRAEQAASLYDCTRGLAGARVLVVDDVMTTGSTLNAVAQALLAAGAGQVVCLVLARTPERARSPA